MRFCAVRVPPVGIVPPIDEVEDGHPSFSEWGSRAPVLLFFDSLVPLKQPSHRLVLAVVEQHLAEAAEPTVTLVPEIPNPFQNLR